MVSGRLASEETALLLAAAAGPRGGRAVEAEPIEATHRVERSIAFPGLIVFNVASKLIFVRFKI